MGSRAHNSRDTRSDRETKVQEASNTEKPTQNTEREAGYLSPRTKPVADSSLRLIATVPCVSTFRDPRVSQIFFSPFLPFQLSTMGQIPSSIVWGGVKREKASFDEGRER